MMKQNKLRVIIITGMALVAMVLFGSALSQTRLQPGEAVNLGNNGIQGGQYSSLFGGNIVLDVLYLIYLASIAALLILIIYMLLTPERRKQLAKFLLRALPILAVLLFVANYTRACSNKTGQLVQPAPGALSTPVGTGLPPAVFTPAASPLVIIIISVVLALMIAGLVVFLILRSQRGASLQTTPLMRLADEAQAALDTVQAGGDLKNAVLRCYFEMSRALVDQRNLKRDRSMTPHEFELLLLSKGMPGESVQLLTRLFEEVRYGTKVPGQREEWMAVSSLTAIIEACKRTP